ncbi:MAG: hypothetical protein CMJ65_15900 [Planctomycetaceae bacterium]|nr:hypothetical protein [Planctomycetaceae bacterium]
MWRALRHFQSWPLIVPKSTSAASSIETPLKASTVISLSTSRSSLRNARYSTGWDIGPGISRLPETATLDASIIGRPSAACTDDGLPRILRVMITAEEFSDGKFDLPEGGRWHELVAGEIQQLDPPDPIHGTVVLNLTKALAEFLDTANQEAAIAPQAAYACYELGLVVRRDPDTVLCPAVSVFVGGDAFAEMDKEVSESRPGMVIEVASSNLRRAGMADRVIEWHGWGVKNVWVVNPEDRSVHVADRGSLIRVATSTDTVSGDPVLPGLNIPVEDLFVEPAWWTSPPRPDSDPDGS